MSNDQRQHESCPDAAQQGADERRPEWEAGRAAGRQWAAEEARLSYLHRLELELEAAHEEGARKKMLITDEHARHIFGGRCAERSHAYIRGFIDGAAEYWSEWKASEHGSRSRPDAE